MKLYNSKTQTIEEFTVPDHEVTLYVCGITPYDTTHLGHAFTYTAIIGVGPSLKKIKGSTTTIFPATVP